MPAQKDTGVLLQALLVVAVNNMTIFARIYKHYINFKLRKLIKEKLLSNSRNITEQEAEQLAEVIESDICSKYWIKDKSRVNQIQKVA